MITKGEWKISKATSDKTSIVVGKVLVAEAHHGTSHSWAHGIDIKEAQCNAALIAAAPALLAACVKVAAWFDKISRYQDQRLGHGLKEACQNWSEASDIEMFDFTELKAAIEAANPK